MQQIKVESSWSGPQAGNIRTVRSRKSCSPDFLTFSVLVFFFHMCIDL